MKKLLTITTFILTLLFTSSCGKNEPSFAHPVSLLDYVVDIGTYKKYDESEMMKYCEDLYLNDFGCSSIVTQVDGKNLVGRNNDISLTENAVFKFVLDINQYKAIGLCYSHMLDGMKYKDVVKHGIDDFAEMIIPFVAADYLNEKGLYIETDMRNEEYGYEVTGTNPGADVDVFLMSFPGYAITRCANVDEVVALANEVNLYNNTDPSKTLTWNYAFEVADAEGNYGLIEVAKNKVIYTPKQNGQANFYVADEFKKDAKYQCGEARYNAINGDLDNVKTLDDMLNHMQRSYYSWDNCVANIDEAPYDIRSEWAGYIPVNDEGEIDLENGSYENCTTEWICDPSRKEELLSLMCEYNKAAYSDYLKEDGSFDYDKIRVSDEIDEFWITMMSIAVDCENKQMKVRFFEDPTQELSFSFTN